LFLELPCVEWGMDRTPAPRRFEDLLAWQRGRELQEAIIQIAHPIAAVDAALADQLRRAARSITANIAEGFERNTRGDFARFLAIAKGSAGEVRSHLYECRDAGVLPAEQFEALKTLAEQTSGLIAKLRGAIQEQRRK
jgi:four helix bundle protein